MKEKVKKYTLDELEKIHEIGIEALRDFASVCQKYHLNYFLVAGAAIGAVRHNGPIPWDDDIDVGMLRDDYEKFFKIAEKELGNKYRIHEPRKTKDYPLFVINLSNKGTIFQRKIYEKLSYKPGIGLDIFPYDFVSENDKKRRKQIRKAWFWNKLLILKTMSSPQVPGRGIIKRVTLVLCWIIHAFLKIPIFSRKMIIKNFYKAAMKKGEKTTMVTSFTETFPEKVKIRLDDIFPLKEFPYGNIVVTLPNDYDKYLTAEYGDYMKLPPESERKSNRPYRLEFSNEDI